MARRLRGRLAAIATAAGFLLLAACASTRVDEQWQDPQFAGGKIAGPVLVVGITSNDAVRRQYEDAMSQRLAERGLQATPSYRVLPAPLTEASSELLLAAARYAGARNVLSSGLIRREVVERTIANAPGWKWDPWYSGWYQNYWPHASGRDMQVFERYVASTSLADAANGKVLWSARTSTEDVGDVAGELQAFARVIVRALAGRGLV